MDSSTTSITLALPPYQQAVLEYLKTDESELWEWFSSNRVRSEYAEATRLELLKSAYRIEREARTELYQLLDEVAAKLEIEAPRTLYQSQQAARLNASLAYIPGEAHVIFHGPVLSTLSEEELRSVLAHEMTHFWLYERWDQDYLTAEQILAAMTHDVAADQVHTSTVRTLSLYNEIFCDRGSYHACGDPAVVISALVKIQTGLTEVSPESYLRQADEIFSRADEVAGAKEPGDPGAVTDGLTHPECFIRARAIQLWAEEGADAEPEITRRIEGPLRLEELDLIGQKKVAARTRRLIDRFLAPAWMQTELVVAHARLFFDDYQAPAAADEDTALKDDLADSDELLKKYYCYVLLDFVAADRGLENAPLARAMRLADALGLGKLFDQAAAKELKLTKKRLRGIQGQADEILAAAEASVGTEESDSGSTEGS